ncbi:CLUMA_CG015455, isoform A [Clunio marinus]|uniref:CLUMA_CG015455, isoform A n=1 Tax=Clunio marinus TaxID=568069 RepID=A0A1J1ISH7_9DIPT|nr:CLUMA_CG015455, isoform A [Clunio marinus]
MDLPTVHGPSDCPWTFRLSMDLPTIHGPSDYPWTFRLSMDLPTVHGPSDCPWTLRLYSRNYQNFIHRINFMQICGLLTKFTEGKKTEVSM